MGATDSKATSDFYMNGAYLASLQGIGAGPQPMFLPGTASQAVTLSQLYSSYSHTTKAVGFTPSSVGIDSFGDIFVTDTTNTSLDLDCLATTANTAQNYRAGAAGNGYANSYCLTNGLAATNGTNLAGTTFKVSSTGVTAGVTFPTSFTNPVDVVLDAANNAYVLDSGRNTAVVTFMPYATLIPSVVIPSGAIVGGTAIFQPQGIAIDGYANLYIADTGNNRILQARTNNAQYAQINVYVPSTLLFGGNPLNGPTGMGIDSAGDLFIADTGNRRIVEYSEAGVPSVVSTPGVTLVSPTSVKVLPSGALVIADSSLGLVLVNNGTASGLSTGSIKLSSTGGLSLDFAGNIYVADPVGGQVVELKISAPGSASFPNTLKPDSSGSHTSTETSYIYNDGNATLNLTAAPTVVDNTSSATNEFSVDGNNACTATASLAPSANCGLVLDFTPSSTAAVYTPVTGAATIADNVLGYSIVASGSVAIGSFGTTGGTQTVNLSGNPIVTFTPQTITFTAPTAVNYSTSIPPFQLVATGGATGNPVVFSIVSGQGTLSGPNNSILTVNNNGTTVIAANQAGGLVNGVYYSAAPQATQTAVVNPIGTIATPTFSVAGGTYTAVQSVTLSDAAAGATIYYTTNGNNPTISSPVYTGQAIPVTITTTIKAIAVGAPGYANSAIASATYTLNPDFTLSTYVSNFTIPNGLGGTATLTVTPLFGFTGVVSFSCSGLSGKDACSFLDSKGNLTTKLAVNSTTLVNGSVYGSLIIQANETASLIQPGARPFAVPGTAFALVLFFGGLRKRKRLATLMLLILGAVGASMMSGCSEVTLTGKTHTSTFTLTATSGSVVHTQTITLNVDNLGN
jgi:sugar lactone lactonase YvrE